MDVSASATVTSLGKLRRQQLLAMAAVASSLLVFLACAVPAEAVSAQAHHAVLGSRYVPVTLVVWSYNTFTGSHPTSVAVAPYNHTGNFLRVFVADDKVFRTNDTSGATLGWLKSLGADVDVTDAALYNLFYLTFFLDYPEHDVKGTVVVVGTNGSPGGDWDYPIVAGTGSFFLSKGLATLKVNTLNFGEIVSSTKSWSLTFYLEADSPVLPKLKAIELEDSALAAAYASA